MAKSVYVDVKVVPSQTKLVIVSLFWRFIWLTIGFFVGYIVVMTPFISVLTHEDYKVIYLLPSIAVYAAPLLFREILLWFLIMNIFGAVTLYREKRGGITAKLLSLLTSFFLSVSIFILFIVGFTLLTYLSA